MLIDPRNARNIRDARLLADLWPPGPFDPFGMHGAVRQWFDDLSEPYELPADEPLTLASYCAARPAEVFVEHLAVGRRLPEMPLFFMPTVISMCHSRRLTKPPSTVRPRFGVRFSIAPNMSSARIRHCPGRYNPQANRHRSKALSTICTSSLAPRWWNVGLKPAM